MSVEPEPANGSAIEPAGHLFISVSIRPTGLGVGWPIVRACIPLCSSVLITVGDMENLKIMEPEKTCEYKWATLQDAEELLQDGSGFTSPLLLSVRSAFAFLSYNK